MSPEASNPFSTGGGGHFFEAKVQAGFLINLLVGGQVPCLPSGAVQSIRLQARQAGFHTDDLVVRLCTETGTEHRLLAQIKHHAVVRVSDEAFCDALGGAWADFSDERVFARGTDALALITGPQSDHAIQHVRPLLDWARTSASSAEFLTKVATAQFSSDKKRTSLRVFRDVLATLGDAPPADDLFWQFLKHLHLLTYDFVMQDSKDEAALLTMLSLARNPASTLDARAIWDGLIVVAQEWNKTAGTFTASELPSRLRTAVQPQRSAAQREAVAKLREHCDLVLDTINTSLAPGVRLPRTGALDSLVDALDSAHVVVVQGAPGSGKSAIVKTLFSALPSITPLAFKAQEFNQPHLHQFLSSIGIGLTAAELKCEFALLPRKVMLVDGAERLFELSTLEAFRQLLQQLRGDDSWTIVITCRESSAQSLREHLLAQWGDDTTTISIPPLSPQELDWVSAQAPHLSPLVANPRLARLLRLPFILSLAWRSFPAPAPAAAAVDIDEHQFKDIVWHHYVERASHTLGGLPIRRSQCLLSVSVARAKRMSLFVSPEGQDADALTALVDDGILITSHAGGFAPAHDVLEDWALSRFVAQEFETTAGEPSRFIDAVGTEPAMRRAFRLWLSDALASPGSTHAIDFVSAAFQGANVPSVWRDETAIAVLQSENAGEFIVRADRLLLSDNKAVHRRLIHVLRTSCKGPNESLLRTFGSAVLRNHAALGTVFVVPVGSGWRELILFTHRHLTAFDLRDADSIAGLLNDWSQAIGPHDPLPAEAQAVAHICLKYWALLTVPEVYADRLEQTFLRLLFKIPHAAPTEIVALIRSAMLNERDHPMHHARTVLEHVTKSLECQALCIHSPELVIQVAEATWRLRPDDTRPHLAQMGLEEAFGFKRSLHFTYFPESALQGPFPFLLSTHPDVAIEFIVRLANEAALSYSKSGLDAPTPSVSLPTADGARPLLASRRLWTLYRGMAAGPHVLECALMSLEAWLLAQAKQQNDVKAVVRKILGTSSSVATIAVLASVALAYPDAVGDEILPVLGVREFYRWDLERSHRERSQPGDMRPTLGLPTGGIDELYHRERQDSANLLHRQNHLETLAFRLQWTQLRDRIWSLLDCFRAALPPADQQTDEDKTWRIALHRMDARHFTAEPSDEPAHVILTPDDPSPDLQAHIAKAAEHLAPIQRRLRLAMWGMARFRREPQSVDAFPDWRDALHEAQALWEERPPATEETPLGLSGPCFVAAQLVRDHYVELEPADLDWCRRVVTEEVLRSDAESTLDARVGRNSFDGSRPSACVLPLLLRGAIDSLTRHRVEHSLAVAVTHSSEEVRDYACEGIRSWLWDIDAELGKACVGAAVKLSRLRNRLRLAFRRQEDATREREDRAVLKATTRLRASMVMRKTVAAPKIVSIDLKTHDWPELLNALSMLRPDTNDPDLRALVMSNLDALLREAEASEAWASSHRGEVSHEFQYAFARLFAQFSLARPVEEATRIGAVLRDRVDHCPKYLGVLLEAFPLEEDKVRSKAVFWSIWQSVSSPVFEHRLLRGSARVWRHDEVRKLVRVLLFADVQWADDVKDWGPLTENKDFVERAAAAVGDTRSGFGALLSLLDSAGHRFLPGAITLLSESLQRGGHDLLDDPGASLQLEVLLRKLCYGFGPSIRQRPQWHRAVLKLLDELVDRGSHTGFRLRDYMLAPLPPEN